MSSLKRILSSRANGARSRGPTSATGKQASSLNAIRHGLLANCIVPSNESGENFYILLDQHIQRYNPIDDVDLGVIEEMIVTAFWRLRRAWGIETRLHEDAMAARESGDELGRIPAGALTDLASSPHLGLLHRCEARLHHIRQRALENAVELRVRPENAFSGTSGSGRNLRDDPRYFRAISVWDIANNSSDVNPFGPSSANISGVKQASSSSHNSLLIIVATLSLEHTSVYLDAGSRLK